MSVAEKVKIEKKEIIQPKKMGLLVENPVYKPFRFFNWFRKRCI